MMKSPNEQIKDFEKWYRVQWVKVSIRYGLSDWVKQLFKNHCCNF